MSTNTKETNTTNQESFKNDNISVNVTHNVGCQVKFEITVSPKATEAARHAAAKSINKEVSIPGFRKGKAPEALIEKNFSSAIDREWKDVLLNTSFKEAMDLTKIYPFKQNSVTNATVKSHSLDKGADLVIEFEEFPRIPQIDFSALTVPHVEANKVTDKNIDDALEQLRLDRATWNEITDRPVQENDYVEVDIDVLSEPAHNALERGKLHVASGKMEPWMRHLIIGKSAGEIAEGMSEKPAHDDCKECHDGSHGHHHHEDDNFKPVSCRITIHSIQQPTLPALDDELAKAYGATDFADFKEKVSKSLNQRAEEQHKNILRSNMQNALLSKYTFDLPLSLIKEELNSHRRPILDDLRSSGVDEKEIPGKLKEIEGQLLSRLDREMRLYLLTQSITQLHNIAVSDNEAMMEWLQHNWMKQMGRNSSNLPENPQEAIATIKSQLLVVKMLDFLLEKAGK